jgi:hypothetical protein
VPAAQLQAGRGPHRFERAGLLYVAPVTAAGDVQRRHLDAAAGQQLQLGLVDRADAAAVPVQPTMMAGAPVRRNSSRVTRNLASGSQRQAVTYAQIIATEPGHVCS